MENEIKWNEPIDDAEFESGLVSRLANRPNAQSSYGQGGLSASALKAWFDKSAMMLKDKLNALISALGSTDALDNILVTVEEGKEPISAKEWIESILNIEIDGEDKTIHDWLEQLSAFVNALNDTIYGSGNVPDESKEGSLIIRVLKLEQDKVDKALISKEIPSSGSDNSIPTVSAVRKNLKDSVAPDLSDNEDDKAPSVKAVNEGLAKKQDNIGLVVSNNEICMIIQEDE